jgi:hypothetical protein
MGGGREEMSKAKEFVDFTTLKQFSHPDFVLVVTVDQWGLLAV